MKSMKFFSALALITSVAFSADNMPASYSPPGGVSVDKAPLFVNIGFDDNTLSSGIDWALNYFDGKKNHAGTGNPKTFDGSDARVSFYMNSYGLDEWDQENPEDLAGGFNRLGASSHEIGNHTYDHHAKLGKEYKSETDAGWSNMTKFLRQSASTTDWTSYLDQCATAIDNNTEVSSSVMKGFRSPFLEYGTNLFPALKAGGFTYDCSIEALSTDGKWRWPYTLDSGSPDHDESWKNNDGNSHAFTVPNTPGLWEMPAYSLIIPDDDACGDYGIPSGFRDRIRAKITWMKSTDIHITGFDYNLWSQAEMTKAEVLGLLKYNLDVRLSSGGNRAPLLFGAHSQYYVGEWAKTNAPNATKEQMQAAITEFLDYALTKEAVRVVPITKIIEWMRDPQELGGASENVAPDGIELSNTSIVKGTKEVGTLTAKDPNAGDTHEFDIVSGDFQISGTTLTNDGSLSVGDHDVKIKVTDQGGLSFSKTFTIKVTEEIQEDTLSSVNIGGYCGWDKVHDNLGSEVTVKEDSTDGYLSGATSTIKRVAHTVGKDSEDNDSIYYDAYASLNAYYDTSVTFKDITALQITYKSDVDFVCILPMAGITSTSGTGHRVTLPKTGDEYKHVVVTDLKNELKQPDWATKVDLDLSKVSTLSFELASESTDAIEGTISISQVKMPGFPVEESIVNKTSFTSNEAIAINTLSANALNLSVATEGMYEVAIYSYNGRILAKVNKNLIAGSNSVNFGNLNLSSSMVLVGITGNGKTKVSKMILK